MQALAKKLKALRIGDVAVRRNPVFYDSMRAQLHALGSADLDARREWTRSRLRQTLSLAARSAYGRRVGGSALLESWPPLQKSVVRGDPGAFTSGSRLLAARASTGGTTGTPLQLTRSLRSIVFEQACIDEMIRRLGADPQHARIAVLRGDNIKDPSDFTAPFWRAAAGGQRLVFSSNHLNANTVAAYAQALEEFRPEVLWAYPTALEALCVSLRRTQRQLRIARVLTSSEMMHPNLWRLAEGTLQCRLLDYYGQAERVAFAYATRAQEYRFLPGYAYVELQPVASAAGHVDYEIVGTALWNSAMPLPRYRTGDLLRLPASWGSAQLEEVTLGTRAFAGVLGRDNDILISPDGVRLTGIDHFQRDVSHVLRIQVIQEAADRVRILVLADAGYDSQDADRLMSNVRAKLPDSMQVSIERSEALERSALGKIPFVIHRPQVRALLNSARATGIDE
jgi:phenylacetate-CoA ligase